MRLDTLDSLIETMKRLMDRVYRANTARLSGDTTSYVAQKIIEIDDTIAMINQIYSLFRYQFDQRKSETGHSNKVEKLLTELKFFVDVKDDKGFAPYMGLVKEKRNEALE